MSMELGDMLRKQREKKKFSFENISEKTKISKAFLAAFEEQRFELLPPEPFASGFVKNYAMALSLNPEEVYEVYRTTRYGAQQELFSAAPAAEEHIPVTDVDEEPTYPRIILIVLAVLGVALAGFLVYRCCGGSCIMKSSVRSHHAIGTPVPRQSEQSIVVSTHSVSQTMPLAKNEQTKVTSVSVGSAQKNTMQEKKNQEQDMHHDNQNQNKNKNEKQNQQNQQNSKAQDLLLEAEGTSQCWIEVRADNEKPSRVMLNASETKVWNAREQFVMKIGNVRGVIVKINGIPLDVEKGNYKGVNTITIDKKKIEELKNTKTHTP